MGNNERYMRLFRGYANFLSACFADGFAGKPVVQARCKQYVQPTLLSVSEAWRRDAASLNEDWRKVLGTKEACGGER